MANSEIICSTGIILNLDWEESFSGGGTMAELTLKIWELAYKEN